VLVINAIQIKCMGLIMSIVNSVRENRRYVFITRKYYIQSEKIIREQN